MLFIDFSSAFNTIIPQQLINKLNLLGLNNSLCNWILLFLTGRPQSVRVGHNTSSETKEVVMDFRRNSDHPALTIDSSTVERVSSTTFLRVHFTEDLTWTTNTMSLSKKAQQRLHCLRRLKRASLPPPILTTFYRGTIESVLTSCITVWYGNCCAADRKTLQRKVNTAAKIISAPLPSILDIFLTRCSSKANSIVEDPTHPSHSLLQLLPSGRLYRSIRARSARLLNSFSPRLWEPWTQLTLPLSETPNKPSTSWNMDHRTPNLTTSQKKL